MDPEAVLAENLHGIDRSVEEKADLILQLCIQMLQNHIVDVRAQMADRSVEQIELVLQTELLKARACSGIQLCALAAVREIDGVDIVHQLQGLRFSDMLVQGAAKVVGNIIFSVRERPGSAEAAHDCAGFAFDAGFDLFAVDRTAALFERTAGLEYGDGEAAVLLKQLIC